MPLADDSMVSNIADLLANWMFIFDSELPRRN